VSMPSWELFREQPVGYRDQVLPPRVKGRLAVEAGASLGWHEWVGSQGGVIGIDAFGASAAGGETMEHHGFTVRHVVERARQIHENLNEPDGRGLP